MPSLAIFQGKLLLNGALVIGSLNSQYLSWLSSLSGHSLRMPMENRISALLLICIDVLLPSFLQFRTAVK